MIEARETMSTALMKRAREIATDSTRARRARGPDSLKGSGQPALRDFRVVLRSAPTFVPALAALGFLPRRRLAGGGPEVVLVTRPTGRRS